MGIAPELGEAFASMGELQKSTWPGSYLILAVKFSERLEEVLSQHGYASLYNVRDEPCRRTALYVSKKEVACTIFKIASWENPEKQEF